MARATIVAVFFAVVFVENQATPYLSRRVDTFEGNQNRLQEYRAMCLNRNGTDEGFRNSPISLEQALQCVERNVHLVQVKLFWALSLAAKSPEDREVIFGIYCPKFNESIQCFDGELAGATVCSSTDGGDGVVLVKHMIQKMVNNWIEVACGNGGRVYLDFNSPGFENCHESVTRYPDCEVSEVVMKTPVAQFGESECSEVKRSRNCFQEKANQCSSTTFMDIYDAYYQPLVDAAGCQRFPSIFDVNGNNLDTYGYDPE